MGAYLPLPEEAAPWNFHQSAYLPVIRGPSLAFRRYQMGDDLEPGALNIAIPSQGPDWAVSDLDWVLVPLTAFDRTGTRVGMGGGFYDQTLGMIPHARRIGVAFDQQQTDLIRRQLGMFH